MSCQCSCRASEEEISCKISEEGSRRRSQCQGGVVGRASAGAARRPGRRAGTGRAGDARQLVISTIHHRGCRHRHTPPPTPLSTLELHPPFTSQISFLVSCHIAITDFRSWTFSPLNYFQEFSEDVSPRLLRRVTGAAGRMRGRGGDAARGRLNEHFYNSADVPSVLKIDAMQQK